MSERVPFHAHIRPLLLLNETNGPQQPTLAVRSNSTLLCTGNSPAPPNLVCSPTTSPRVLKPSMFLVYFSVLQTDVDRSLQTTRTASFRFVQHRGRSKVAWTIDWSTFSSLFDTHGEYRGQAFSDDEGQRGWMLGYGGPTYTEPSSLSRISSSLTSTRSKVVLQASQRRESRSSLMFSLSLHLRHPLEGYTMVLAAPSRCQPTPQERAAR